MTALTHVLFALSQGLRAVAEHLAHPQPAPQIHPAPPRARPAPPVPRALARPSFVPQAFRASSSPALTACDAPTVLMMTPLGAEPPTTLARRRCLEDAPTVLADHDDILSLLEEA